MSETVTQPETPCNSPAVGHKEVVPETVMHHSKAGRPSTSVVKHLRETQCNAAVQIIELYKMLTRGQRKKLLMGLLEEF